jgi:hypothetical protein
MNERMTRARIPAAPNEARRRFDKIEFCRPMVARKEESPTAARSAQALQETVERMPSRRIKAHRTTKSLRSFFPAPPTTSMMAIAHTHTR